MAVKDQRTDQIFPELSRAQLERVARYGRVRELTRGEVVFRPGQKETPFFAIKSGAITITAPIDADREKHIVTHGVGQFTGEINMFSSRVNLVFGRVEQGGEAIELDRAQFRQLVAQDYELSELIMRAFILRRVSLLEEARASTALVGSSHDPETLRLRKFMARNGHPFEFLDVEREEDAGEALEALGADLDSLPMVILGGQKTLRRPSPRALGELLGVSHHFEQDAVHDLVVIGAGPSGLAAAVYAASEGLSVVALEEEAWGGQAASSSKIENYLGFPTGISGGALAARGYNQAQKFGAEIAIPHRVNALDCTKRPFAISTDAGDTLLASAVIIATGATYRALPVKDLERFDGKGVHYGATRLEAMMCQGEEVVVVGGGNSAGQAAVFLADQAAHVHLVIRREDLTETMSRYLISRIEGHPQITMHCSSEVVEAYGEEVLEELTIRHNASGQEQRKRIGHLFVMIGAVPNTDWLQGCVALDEAGFVLTGAALNAQMLSEHGWSLERAPHMVETSTRGIFAVGDVRSGSVKRVASAVGEGSIAVQFVHGVLAEG